MGNHAQRLSYKLQVRVSHRLMFILVCPVSHGILLAVLHDDWKDQMPNNIILKLSVDIVT